MSIEGGTVQGKDALFSLMLAHKDARHQHLVGASSDLCKCAHSSLCVYMPVLSSVDTVVCFGWGF